MIRKIKLLLTVFLLLGGICAMISCAKTDFTVEMQDSGGKQLRL